MNPLRATLTLAGWLAVIGICLIVGCVTMPKPAQMPQQRVLDMLAYSDPPHPSPMPVMSVLMLPTPPGAAPQTVTNVSVRPIAHMLAVLPPPKPLVKSFAADYPPYHGPVGLLATCETATNLNGPWTVIGSTQYPSNGATLTLNLTNGAARKFARFGWVTQ